MGPFAEGDYKMPFDVGALSQRSCLRLLGNGVHLPSVGIFTWFCLSNLMPKNLAEPMTTMGSAGETDSEAEADGEDI